MFIIVKYLGRSRSSTCLAGDAGCQLGTTVQVEHGTFGCKGVLCLVLNA